MGENEKESVPNVAQLVDQDTPKTYDVFISYRRDGGLDLARSIAYWFRAHGFKCFIDQTEMQTGQFNQQIYRAIEDTHYFLLLLSEHALDRCSKEGDWVRKEIEHAREKKVPFVPFTPLPDVTQALPRELPPTLQFLRDTECWQFDRQKNFESTLQEMVKRQMPLFKDRVNFAEKDKEDRLYLSIRYYKRNDGTIDDKEYRQLVAEARGYGIEERLQNMINLVESEWDDEQKLIGWAVDRFRLTQGKLSKADMEEVQKQAGELNIAPSRRGELQIEIEQKIRQNAAQEQSESEAGRLKQVLAEKADMEKKLGKLEGQLAARGSESEKRRKKCLVLTFVLLLVLLLVPLAWWYGRGSGDDEASRRMESEMEQMQAEVAQAKEAASREKAAAESAKQEAERIAVAEKRAADALRARERAEKETEEAKSKLLAANKATAAVEAARQEAEKQLAEAKAHAEKRRAEALATIEAERTARKDAEVKSAETAAELNLAKEKAQQLEAELSLAKKKAQQLEAEKDSLQKDYDQAKKELARLRRMLNEEVRNP